MSPIILYLAKSVITLVIFYLCYILVQHKQPYFNYNRFFLVLAIFTSMLLPLLDYNLFGVMSSLFTQSEAYSVSYPITVYQLSEVIIGPEQSGTFSLFNLFFGIYATGLSLRALQLLGRLANLFSLSRKFKTVKESELTFVITKSGLPTFSFFNSIFVSPDVFSNKETLETIVAHEKIHVQQLHSFDVLLAELIIVVQWFNPFAYLLRTAIKENHEYIADEEVMKQEQDPSNYRLLLLEHATEIKTNILTHNFSYSLLKRRLQMMKEPKKPIRFGFSIALAAIAISMVVFACSQPDHENEMPGVESSTENKVSDELTNEGNEAHTVEINVTDSIYKVVDQMPEYPGGIPALMTYLGENIKYPEQAKKDGVSGKVFVQFVVGKDGHIANTKVLRGIGGGCDEEAVRVIKNMPNWSPGMLDGEPVNVQYNIPIKFSLD